MIDQADIVLSMRYHGCILAILRGKQVFGLRVQKCFDLLSHYGNELSFSNSISTDISKDIEYFSPMIYLSADRQIFIRELGKALSFIPRSSARGSSRCPRLVNM
jgi:hypothetical protein